MNLQEESLTPTNMAETFLFAITESAVSKLASLAAEQISPAWNIKSEVRRLHSTLSTIKAVILDAEEQQFKNHEVRNWLEKLKDAVCSIDDLLDDFNTRALQKNMELSTGILILKRVKRFLSSSNYVVFRFKIGYKIRGLRLRLDQIAADRSKFHFTEKTHTISIENVREQTHSYVRPSDIIGRDSDKENIVDLLLTSSNDDNDHVSVIPIVGIGGLGKTTVVKLAYNDERVIHTFDRRLWFSSVSEDFSVSKTIEKILQSATGESFGHLDMDQKQCALADVLKGTRYLLVLDDVWNKDRIKWMDLMELLMNCSSRSKIIVTTRSRDVAVVTSTREPYDLSGLSDDDCLSLFLRCAFRQAGDWLPNLVAIGREIVKKCGGVPLAVKTLGSLLYMNTDEQEWLRIKNNDIWEIDQKQSDILPILKLSYEQLPSHLRQCFAYCSMLPKGVEIPRESFINLWIAQGLVHSDSASNQQIEDVGNQYFNELLSRFCFQEVVEAFDGEIIACKIHNLVHDLAQSVGGSEYFKKGVSDRIRHIYLQNRDQPGKEESNALLRLRNVRSFRCPFKINPLDKVFIHAIATRFRRLRVLILISLHLEELPSSIGNLKRLKYLDLSHSSNLKSLPSSFCKLVNLQTLNLINCESLQDLPNNLLHLINIRTLYLTCHKISLGKRSFNSFSSLQFLLLYNCDFEHLPPGLENLTSIRVLRIYDCPRLAALPHSINFLVSLDKLWMWNCEELDFGEGDAIRGLTGLKSLLLMGLPKLITLPVGLTENVARTLKFLRIANCVSFTTLPEWVLSFNLLQRLYVEDCPDLVMLPELVHSHIGKVHISGCPKLGQVG